MFMESVSPLCMFIIRQVLYMYYELPVVLSHCSVRGCMNSLRMEGSLSGIQDSFFFRLAGSMREMIREISSADSWQPFSSQSRSTF